MGPTMADVRAAAARIAPHAVRTPLLESAALNDLVGGRVLLKAECLQVTGSFKLRGALNTMLQLDPDERARGVVAWSSGNHALAVSRVAGLLGVHATIVMPADAPRPKLDGVRANGATLRLYDRLGESREEVGTAIAQQSGAAIVRPYDDPRVVAGQGTLGLELVQQAEERAVALDAVLCPASGGGLSAGIATAVHAEIPGTAVHTVEPAGFDDVARSLAAGRPVRNAPGGSTLCDALQAPTPGEVTFPVLQEHGVTGLVVDDDEVRAAMRTAFGVLRLVVEPGGAAALAAVLAGRVEVAGRVTAVVLSGGNVDPDLYARVITGTD